MSFEEPEVEPLPPRTRTSPALNAEQHAILRQFRFETLLVGAYWIVTGGLGAVVSGESVLFHLGVTDRNYLGTYLLEPLDSYLFLGLTLPVALAGVGTVLRKVAAVYVGLAFSYLSLVGNLLTLNMCGMALAVCALFTGHRALSLANQLRAAGVPLDAKP